jgi:hypothetical protein
MLNLRRSELLQSPSRAKGISNEAMQTDASLFATKWIENVSVPCSRSRPIVSGPFVKTQTWSKYTARLRRGCSSRPHASRMDPPGTDTDASSSTWHDLRQ